MWHRVTFGKKKTELNSSNKWCHLYKKVHEQTVAEYTRNLSRTGREHKTQCTNIPLHQLTRMLLWVYTVASCTIKHIARKLTAAHTPLTVEKKAQHQLPCDEVGCIPYPLWAVTSVQPGLFKVHSSWTWYTVYMKIKYAFSTQLTFTCRTRKAEQGEHEDAQSDEQSSFKHSHDFLSSLRAQ